MADTATDNPFAAIWGTQPAAEPPNPFAQFAAPAVPATPDPDIFASAIKTAGEHSAETAVSPKGARSAMQVLGVTAANPGFGVKPAQSAADLDRVGRDYSQALLSHYGDPTLAAAAYNAGPGNVDKWLAKYGDPRKGEISSEDFADRIPYRETRGYVNRVSGYLGGAQGRSGVEQVNFQTAADHGPAPSNDNPFAQFAQPTAPASNPFAQFGPKATPPVDTGLWGALTGGVEKGAADVGKTLNVGEQAIGPYASGLAHIMLAVAGPVGIAQEAELSAMERAGKAPAPAPTVAAQPLTLSGGFDPHSVAEKTLYGLGESTPTLVGAIAGGPFGAAGGAALQSFGPAVEAHKGAVGPAVLDTALDSAFTAAGFKAFEFAPFKGAVKNLVTQGLGVQPAIAITEHVVDNYRNGRPLKEGIPDAYLQGALPNTLIMGLGHFLHATVSGAARGAQATGTASTPAPNTGFEQPGLPQLPPPSGGGAHPEAVDAEFEEVPPAGTAIGLKMPNAAPQRATVVGTFENGKFTTVQFENGQHRDYRTEDVLRDITGAPPRAAEPTEPSVPHAPISESERFDLEGDYLPPAQGGREPSQPTLNADAVRALDVARGLEQAAVAPRGGNYAPSDDERLGYMKQAAALRQQYGVPADADLGTYRHPLAGDPSAGLGELAVARLRNPALYDPNAARPGMKAAGVPDPDYAAALADVKMARFPARNEPDLFQTIKSFGGLRTKDASGNPTPDTANLGAVLQDVKYPGLINNKTGMSPDYMREALAQRGWFGGNRDPGQTDLNDFYNLVSQQAQGSRVYHPESTLAAEQAVRDGLDEEMSRAGVASTDSHQDAAKKLVEFRQSERADLLAWELDHRTDQILSTLDPEAQERLKSYGYEPGADVGAEHEAAPGTGTNEPRSEVESGSEDHRPEGTRDIADERAVTPAGTTAATSQGVVEPRALDFEQFAAEHGASRQDIGDAGLHRGSKNQSKAARERNLKNQLEKDQHLVERREALRDAYNAALSRGEIRQPSATERLIATARGHEDNEATRAARRLLAKRGIDYRQETAPVGEATSAQLKEAAGRKRIEEAAQLPRAHGKKAQKSANEGLFAPEKAATGDLLGTAAHPVKVETAADLRTAERHVETEPSEAQVEAGNYKKGHLTLHGLDVAIENPAGSERKGVGPDGEPWSVTLQHPYGYVKGTKGADGDHVDVYIGPHPESRDVFVVDQVDPKTKKFDEVKAVLGAKDIDEARAIYDAGFSDGSGPERRAAITAVNVEDFRKFLDEGDHKKPFAKSEVAKDAELPPGLAEEGEEYAPTFFSALTRGVENAKQNKAPAEQWKGVIRNLPGVKDEERLWSGVDGWLDSHKGPVTKADLLKYVRENEVRVQEVEHGKAGEPPSHEQYEALFDWIHNASDLSKQGKEAATTSLLEMVGEHDGTGNSRQALGDLEGLGVPDALIDPYREWLNKGGLGAKFGSYTLPGGKNYRELLLTLPPSVERGVFHVEGDGRRNWHVKNSRGEIVTTYGSEAYAHSMAQDFNTSGLPAHIAERAGTPDFRAGHWDEPNVLAHVRFDDRTGPNGERVLHMAEVQSDWHQKGRREGYKAAPDEIKRLAAAREVARNAMLDAHDAAVKRVTGGKHLSQSAIRNDPDYSTVEAFRLLNESDKALRTDHAVLAAEKQFEEAKGALERAASDIPNAPFKTSWHELALKRMLRYASEHGYDRLSWDTGDTNADRYDLSKHISELHWQRGNLVAYDAHGKEVIKRTGMRKEELPDVVGKDVADKLLAQKPGEGGWQTLEGQALKIGGEGMKGFYDKILPAAANKIAKKWGVKVGSSAVGDERAEKGYEVGRSREKYAVFRNTGGEPISKHDTEAEADAAAAKLNEATGKATTPVHSLPITPEMRDSVRKGQALFEQRAPYKLSEDDIGGLGSGRYTDLTRNFDRLIRRSGTPRTPHGLTDAIAKYLLDRGEITGHETLAVYDAAAGDVSHVSTSGEPAVVKFSEDLAKEMADPNSVLVGHHNHPSGRSLSSSDVASLAMPGLHWIVAYAPDGHVYAARLTPRFRGLISESRPGENAQEAAGRRAQMILDTARQISSSVRDEMMKHIVNGDITRDEANDLHARLLNSIMAHEGLIEYISTKPFTSAEVRISDAIANAIGTKADYRPAGPVQRADGIARILEDVGRDAARRSGSSLNPARNFGLSRSAGAGGAEGLAQPPKEYEDAPINAPEGRDYQDNVAEALGAELGEKGAGTYARKMAAGFKEDKGRPTKHLSGLMGSVERQIIMPRTLAATDWRSAKYWEAWRKRDDTAATLLHQAAEGSKSYVALGEHQHKSLHAIEELARLKGIVLDDDGRPIVMRNDLGITPKALREMQEGEIADRLHASGIDPAAAREAAKQVKAGYASATDRVLDHLNPPLAHSKFGQVIELDPETTKAFFERRELFRQRWRDLMKGAATKLGWRGSLDPADIRGAAGNAKTGAERKHLEHVADLMEAMGAQERPGYVPFMRFGDYFVAVTPKAGVDKESLGGFPRVVHFELVDSAQPLEESLRKWNFTTRREGEVPKAAKDKIAELRARYPASHYDIEHAYVARRPEQLRNLDIPAVEKLLTVLGQKDTALFAPMVDELREKMYEEMKAGFKKKALSVPGWSPDFARTSGAYFHWTSNHVADLTHGEDIRSAKEQYVDRHPDAGTRRFWKSWGDYQDAPSEKMRALQQFGFYWELALNPSSSAAIALHAPMVGTFTLGTGLEGAGDAGGVRQAGGHLYPAIGQVYRGMRGDLERGLHIDLHNIPGLKTDEKAALERAETSGLLHAAAAEDLAGMMQHGSEALGENRKLWNQALRVASSNISAVDRTNRIGMWLAAYRMAKNPKILDQWGKIWNDNQLWREMAQGGMTPEKAARFMVDEGVFVWGKRNRPQISRGALGTLVFGFRQFEMNYLSSIWKLLHRMGPAGRLSGLLMMGALATFAGMQGLPFVQDIEGLAENLSKILSGVDPMLEAGLYHVLENMGFGKMGADMVLKGAPRAILGVDLSNRLGFGNVVTRDLNGNPVAALGAIPGITYNAIAGAANKARRGQYLGAASSLMPAAIRNPFVAGIVWPNEGVRSQFSQSWQIPTMSPEQLSAFDLAVRGAGFEPSDVSKAWDARIYNERARAAQKAGLPPRVTPGFVRPAPNNPYGQ